MTTIVEKYASKKNMYLHFLHGDMYEVRRLPLNKYKYALTIYDGENPDFLYTVSWPTRERDIIDSYSAVAVH